ncbi:acetyl-CoA carboxylase carboxyl transferase subunit alpha [Marchantia polymorpha subsp. ruderalis]|nr:hypothetical protein MARPO_0083s0025 [Marchantia polymorpha]PTQ34057.1 hypothetical protein MARPO_0083s0025 [Marchantia polymorpha]BBN19710.1 hypothetical protein Mp_8g12960 [Marchantia polymorpha subsp. ruderalis]BBN19711.1 hypothetical protein Mp_8g12960 [Marchantia polymorpha subsp. ruderalis]|eukprot:PTQ34056.1 hypothetical protein MARPO_0083s0025 [Marchantia polymorpha]
MGFGTGALVLQQTSVAAPRFASISQVNGSSLDAFRNGADLPLCSHLQSHRNGIAQGSGQAGFATTRSSNKLLQTRIDSETSRVVAKIRKGKKSAETEYPWPEKLKGDEQEGYLEFLSGFKPLPTKPKPVTLPFERPLVDLENKIDEVRELANKTGMDFSEQIKELEQKYDQVRRDLYLHLTPVQRLSVARHPNRPTFLDHVLNITDKWVELHGDRGGYDDPALVCGIGKIEGMSFMFMGHQKGRNTKENIYRNFAMPTPNGYRKALRMMRHADHHGFPILSFIDTPGAYAGIKAEELGQGEAIAHNLREMFGLRVPIITTVIGEGGSGGALAIGCCDKMIMLENAVYYVASPEACAAILWKTAAAAPKATEALRITGMELMKLDVVDEVIPEPLGGAHSDPVLTSKNIKATILKYMKELLKLDPETLMKQRVAKFRQMGAVEEGVEVDAHIKRNMKKREAPLGSEDPRLLTSGLQQSLDVKISAVEGTTSHVNASATRSVE